MSLALGSVAGIGAARVATSHYSVIVKDTAQMMIAGPALVDYAMPGPHYDKNELGGSHVHVTTARSTTRPRPRTRPSPWLAGSCRTCRRSVDELPPRAASDDDPERREEALLSIVPRNPRHVYKMRQIIEAIVDRESRRHVVVLRDRPAMGQVDHLRPRPPRRLARRAVRRGPVHLRRRVDGLVVAEGHARSSTSPSTFHLPLVHLVDCPGFLIGLQAEQEGTIRYGSRALAALGESPSPYCSVVIRKAFGVAGAAN